MNVYRFSTKLPEGYEQNLDKEYPILFYLKDNRIEQGKTDKKRIDLLKYFQQKGIENDIIVVNPHLPAVESWKAAKLYQTLQMLFTMYRIDLTRIYFVGLGYGGFGALKFATLHPSIPTAIVSISGGGNENMALYLQQIPVWMIHGIQDELIPIHKANSLASKMEDSVNFKYTVVENQGCNLSKEFFEQNDIISWLLINKK